MTHKYLEQVIKELQALLEEHGNLPVIARGPYEYEDGVNPEITYEVADEYQQKELGVDAFVDIVGSEYSIC